MEAIATALANDLLLGLVFLVCLGIGAQWLAARLHIPSILILLGCGLLAGPVTGVLDPEALLGELLLPVIALSVAVILFEGGLTLEMGELPRIGGAVRGLLLIGVPVTWGLVTVAARLLLDLPLDLSVLLGAILVVTGPTVVLPLVRQLRPRGDTGPILRWEGILNDVIGATLAVLTFEFILEGTHEGAAMAAVLGIGKTLVVGSLLGLLLGGGLVVLLARHWIPDVLQSPVTLAAALLGYTLSDLVQHESGLLTTTVMGIVLVNQKKASIRHIVEFKESLRSLLIASIFILLAARLEMEALRQIDGRAILFLGVLILVVRLLAVFVSTPGTRLSLKEKVFLSWMAPRGIVAAAVISVFALQLQDRGIEGAERLIPLVFLVIIGTIAVYGLTAPLLARMLGLSDTHPQGLLLVEAHPFTLHLASALASRGIRIVLADTNRHNVRAARMAGLQAVHGNALTEDILDHLDLDGIGRVLALTSNSEANALIALHFLELFGRAGIYQLPGEDQDTAGAPAHLRGRILFHSTATFEGLHERFLRGARIKDTRLTAEFDLEDYLSHHGEDMIPLFVVSGDGTLTVLEAGKKFDPRTGQRLITLVGPETSRKKQDATPEEARA